MITVFLTSVFFKPFLTVAGKCVQPKTLRRSSGGVGWFICIRPKASYDYIFGSFYFHFAQPLLPLLQHR